MSFVLDSSLAVAFVLQDEITQVTDDVLDSLGEGVEAFAPALWRWEVGNALAMAERRKRITEADTHRCLTALQSLPIHVDEDAWREAWNATFLLARKYQLSVYDAAYLELAIRRRLSLASLDTDLRKAAKAEGLGLLPGNL
jgi:predicted nucleic acid-binding protein